MLIKAAISNYRKQNFRHLRDSDMAQDFIDHIDIPSEWYGPTPSAELEIGEEIAETKGDEEELTLEDLVDDEQADEVEIQEWHAALAEDPEEGK